MCPVFALLFSGIIIDVFNIFAFKFMVNVSFYKNAKHNV
jgi:hypothetical protein